MSSLKPCPWCGSSGSINIEPMWNNSHGYYGCYSYQVKCITCNTSAPNSKFDTIDLTHEEAKNRAITAWNTRKENNYETMA